MGFRGAAWKPLGVPGTPEPRPRARTARPGDRPKPQGLGVWLGLGCAVKMHNVSCQAGRRCCPYYSEPFGEEKPSLGLPGTNN